MKDTAEQLGGKVCIVTKPKAAGRKSKDGEGTGNKSSKGKSEVIQTTIARDQHVEGF